MMQLAVNEEKIACRLRDPLDWFGLHGLSGAIIELSRQRRMSWSRWWRSVAAVSRAQGAEDSRRSVFISRKLFSTSKNKTFACALFVSRFLLFNVWQICFLQLSSRSSNIEHNFPLRRLSKLFFRKQLKFSRLQKHFDGEKSAPKKFEWELRVCRKCSWCKQLCRRGHNHQTWFVCTQSLWATAKAGSSRNMKRYLQFFNRRRTRQ